MIEIVISYPFDAWVKDLRVHDFRFLQMHSSSTCENKIQLQTVHGYAWKTLICALSYK